MTPNDAVKVPWIISHSCPRKAWLDDARQTLSSKAVVKPPAQRAKHLLSSVTGSSRSASLVFCLHALERARAPGHADFTRWIQYGKNDSLYQRPSRGEIVMRFCP